MMHPAKTLRGYNLHCRDGEVGTVNEFLFDDKHWTVRYLVADTGSWLTGRQVLISPYALTSVHPENRYITVDLTRLQIEESPSLESNQPVSRQFEETYYNYFGWPTYWGGPYMWGTYRNLSRDPSSWQPTREDPKAYDPNLRSTRDVSGHHLQAVNGEIGHVDDFIIDEEYWTLRYILADTRNWLPGRHVLVSPRWIDRVSWTEKKVFVNLTREAIQKSPLFTPQSLLTRDYEAQLYRHYDRYGYWFEEMEVGNRAGQN